MTFKGYYVLEKYLESFGTSNLDCVIIGRDNHIDCDYFNEIKELCQRNNIVYHERSSEINLQSDYAFSISWRWMINEKVKLIVLHDSLLPRYRGFAPLVNSLINKEKQIGVTALFASHEYDKGDIIAQKGVSINYPIKIKKAIDLLLPVYSNLVNEIATKILNNIPLESISQNDFSASYSLWRDEQDYEINWLNDSDTIKRFIDAVGDPYSGASTYIEERKVRILDAESENDVYIENRTPGKIIFIKEGKPVIVCGEGLLSIEKMIDDSTRDNLIPFQKFKVRFK